MKLMVAKQAVGKRDGEPAVKVIQGRHHHELGKWERFDRLQRSLRPLRKGKHPHKGIHYGSE